MANTQQESGITGMKELLILSGILVTVVAGTIVTYWVGSRGVDAETGTAAGVAPAEAQARVLLAAPAPAGSEVVHTDVYFDFKSARLRAETVRVLQENAAIVTKGGSWVVLVQGYADQQGPAAYNRTLAQRRAEEVKQFLVELGVAETSIKVVTIGQDGSLCDDPGKECQQLNRRVHLEMRKLGSGAAPSAAAQSAAAPVRPVIAVGDVLDVGPAPVPPATQQ